MLNDAYKVTEKDYVNYTFSYSLRDDIELYSVKSVPDFNNYFELTLKDGKQFTRGGVQGDLAESKIFKKNDFTKIKNLLEALEHPKQLKLIFRASEHPFTCREFH
jgi:hypothetical protein